MSTLLGLQLAEWLRKPAWEEDGMKGKIEDTPGEGKREKENRQIHIQWTPGRLGLRQDRLGTSRVVITI